MKIVDVGAYEIQPVKNFIDKPLECLSSFTKAKDVWRNPSEKKGIAMAVLMRISIRSFFATIGVTIRDDFSHKIRNHFVQASPLDDFLAFFSQQKTHFVVAAVNESMVDVKTRRNALGVTAGDSRGQNQEYNNLHFQALIKRSDKDS